MNAFNAASKVEAHAMPEIIQWLRENGTLNKIRPTAGSDLDLILQKYVGDFVVTDEHGAKGIELKVEAENKYNNFFLETWSNKSRFTKGWMYTLKTDFLFYYFFKCKTLYTMDFQKLQEWSFGKDCEGELYNHPERCQNKYDQKNDTWGRCVPIDILIKAVDAKTHTLEAIK